MGQFLQLIAIAVLTIGLAVPQAVAATTLNLLYIPGGDFVPAFVAKDQGIFERHGLDVDMSIAQNGSVISAALAADQAQIGVPTPPVLLQANEQGLDLVAIAGATVLPFPKNAAGVIARDGSNLKGPKDLVGHKVGVPGFGGSFDVVTRYWVKANGGDYKQVNWVEVQFPQMGDALKSGLVDATLAVNPFYARILNAKLGTDIGNPWNSAPNGTMIVLYASTRAWATKNKEAAAAGRGEHRHSRRSRAASEAGWFDVLDSGGARSGLDQRQSRSGEPDRALRRARAHICGKQQAIRVTPIRKRPA